jgi:hypothetical protein
MGQAKRDAIKNGKVSGKPANPTATGSRHGMGIVTPSSGKSRKTIFLGGGELAIAIALTAARFKANKRTNKFC